MASASCLAISLDRTPYVVRTTSFRHSSRVDLPSADSRPGVFVTDVHTRARMHRSIPVSRYYAQNAPQALRPLFRVSLSSFRLAVAGARLDSSRDTGKNAEEKPDTPLRGAPAETKQTGCDGRLPGDSPSNLRRWRDENKVSPEHINANPPGPQRIKLNAAPGRQKKTQEVSRAPHLLLPAP